MSVSVDGSNGITFNDGSSQTAAASPFGLKNRIINGAMEISQRNGTSATTVNGNDIYTLDRFKCWANGGGVFTVTQSTTAPTGFNNSALITVTTADSSIAAGDNYRFAQAIEGYNIADLGFGTANAKTVTLSFWVRSNITGTFGGSLYSVSGTRSYVFNYTISSANTWEQKTVTIAGDTSGTWGTTNSYGITVYFDLGSGSNYENATGSWVAAEKFRTSGNATLISTLNNTLYLTGVQLEIGSTATPFERRMYTNEFQLCQRYFQTISNGPTGSGSTTQFTFGTLFPVVMRTAPSGAVTAAIRISDITTASFTQSSGSIITNLVTPEGGSFHLPNFTGMTANRPALVARDGTGVIQLSAEL